MKDLSRLTYCKLAWPGSKRKPLNGHLMLVVAQQRAFPNVDRCKTMGCGQFMKQLKTDEVNPIVLLCKALLWAGGKETEKASLCNHVNHNISGWWMKSACIWYSWRRKDHCVELPASCRSEVESRPSWSQSVQLVWGWERRRTVRASTLSWHLSYGALTSHVPLSHKSLCLFLLLLVFAFVECVFKNHEMSWNWNVEHLKKKKLKQCTWIWVQREVEMLREKKVYVSNFLSCCPSFLPLFFDKQSHNGRTWAELHVVCCGLVHDILFVCWKNCWCQAVLSCHVGFFDYVFALVWCFF